MPRNSQKRFYDETNSYFITTNTENRFPFFKEDIFCELFVENLRLCKKLKDFEIYAFAILPDHVHLLIYPYEKYNISQIIQSIKGNVSCDINRVIYYSRIEGETPASRLQDIKWERILEIYNKKGINIKKYINQFRNKYGPNPSQFPAFKWHPSFHDHVIRGEYDFQYHYDYTIYNPEKHGLVKNAEDYQWQGLNPQFDDFMDPA